jgi:hypothetical protein
LAEPEPKTGAHKRPRQREEAISLFHKSADVEYVGEAAANIAGIIGGVVHFSRMVCLLKFFYDYTPCAQGKCVPVEVNVTVLSLLIRRDLRCAKLPQKAILDKLGFQQ